MTLQNLSLWDVAIAALLIVVNGAVSVALKLDLERKLAWAAVRTVVQLLAIGYVLGWVFAFNRWFVVLPLMVLMTLIAGFAGAQRGARTYAGQRADSIVSIWFSSWLVAAVGLFVVIRIRPWYEPQYAIPILGMILGNTLTGVSLGIERMTEELTSHRDRVEMALALGATRWEAAQGPDSDTEPDGGGGRCQPARHDDRPGTRRSVPLAGGPVSDRDHVPDRRIVSTRYRGRGAADIPAAVFSRPPVSGGEAGGASRRREAIRRHGGAATPPCRLHRSSATPTPGSSGSALRRDRHLSPIA
jgi:ABC-type iron transport system FetAB permease component